MSGTLVIISSPSGGGKGTLVKEILARVPAIGFSVSYTTRPMRDGEEDGREYHFVSRDEFERRTEANEFLEYALVHGNYYGTSRAQVERETSAGRDIVLEIDVQGAIQVLERFPDALSIFILPPSFAVLKERLAARGTESEESLDLRLRNSLQEVAEFGRFKYSVVNDDKEVATAELQSIILADRQRSIRQTDRVQAILDSFDASKNTQSGE